MTAAGLLGIAGGAAILAGFVPGIPWTREAFQLRLVLFNAGAIAAVAAVLLPRWSRPLSRSVAAAAIAANAWYLLMVVLSIGRPQPPDADPDFRLIGFFAGAAMWLADAAFGAIALRDRAIVRPAALMLCVGSVLAFLGMDRLELVRGDLAWLFTPLALTGIALNGLAWIIIGVELLWDRRDERREGAAPEAG